MVSAARRACVLGLAFAAFPACDSAVIPGSTAAPTGNVVVLQNAAWGFFDFGMNTTAPAGTRNVCIDLRVTGADGSVTWAQGDPTIPAVSEAEAIAGGALCSSTHGNAGGGDLLYVGTCDAAAPQATATVWLKGVYFDDATPEAERQWANPCPAATPGTDAATWTGGCRVEFRCLQNEDVDLAIDVDLLAGTFKR